MLLNNDIEIISENWLEEMLMYSQREDVGAVGAKENAECVINMAFFVMNLDKKLRGILCHF